jgi:hypothetical protein
LEETKLHQERIKESFDKKVKSNVFKTGDLVLKWDATRQEKGKHDKFEALWTGPFVITAVQQNNTFVLQTISGEEVAGGPLNGLLVHILFQFFFLYFCHLNNSMPNGTRKTIFQFSILNCNKATESS